MVPTYWEGATVLPLAMEDVGGGMVELTYDMKGQGFFKYGDKDYFLMEMYRESESLKEVRILIDMAKPEINELHWCATVIEIPPVIIPKSPTKVSR